VETKLFKLGFASIEFEYKVTLNGKVLAEGKTKHPFVNRDFCPVRMPAGIKELLEKNDA
jgi:acyl-CoA thioesterase FadM